MDAFKLTMFPKVQCCFPPRSPGQEFRADFHLRGERGYRVVAQFAGAPSGRGVAYSIANASGQSVWFDGMKIDPAHGQFIAPAVPAGTWTLHLTANDNEGHQSEARQEIAVGHSDVTNVQLFLHSPASIPVTVNHPSVQGTDNAPLQVTVDNGFNPGISAMLISTDPLNFQMNGMQQQGDPQGGIPSLAFINVLPGKYKLDVRSFGSECVESAWYGSTDLTRDYLVVGPDGETQPITINLVANCSVLSTKLRSTGQAGFVIIVPNSSIAEPRVVPIQAAQPNQVFNSSETLSPGSYRVFAFSSIDGLEYSNPEALRDFPSQSVTLGPGQKSDLTLELTERKEN